MFIPVAMPIMRLSLFCYQFEYEHVLMEPSVHIETAAKKSAVNFIRRYNFWIWLQKI